MPCLIVLFALFVPRLMLALIFLFSDYLGRAYDTTLWPILGFLFMPLTTLVYAFAINSQGSVSGIHLLLVILAALIDLGGVGGGEKYRRRRRAA